MVSSFNFKSVPHHKLKYEHSVSTKIAEPSDVVYDKETNHIFIVSDHNGGLYECETNGKIIRKAKYEGLDCEGVEIKDSFVYVADESGRKVYKYGKAALNLIQTYPLPYTGPRNSGFESITYNETKHCFVLITEKDPTVIYEMDNDFHVLRTKPFKGVRDISSARWYKGAMYLLSDLDAEILRCNPTTYEVEEEFSINVFNPEGLSFDNDGNITITSDNLQRIYYFKNPQTDT